jgi:hypothetical protein
MILSCRASASMDRACSTHGGEESIYRVLVGKLEGRGTPKRPTYRWEDNIKIVIREVGWGGMDWIDLAQGRDRWRALVDMIMNLLVP